MIESFRFFGFLFRPGAITKKTLSDLPYFRLNAEGKDKPISYEISFFLNGVRYRYGIEVDSDGICSEWLYFVPKRQEACYFERDRDQITRTGTYFKDKKALQYIKPDSTRPFLFTLAQDSVRKFDWAKSIVDYFRFYIRSSDMPETFFKNMMDDEIACKSDSGIISKDEVVSYLRLADSGITDVSVIEKNAEDDELIEQLTEFVKQRGAKIEFERERWETFFHHAKYDNDKLVGDEKFPLRAESRGTFKLYCMLYPILCVLKKGGVLLVDEIESSLHPLLCEKIVQVFNSSKTNPRNAQLLFTTHNTFLMNRHLLRRDQIYFVEKDDYGASDLYSLYDVDLDIRSNFNYEDNYLAGRFGAIPYVSDFCSTK